MQGFFLGLANGTSCLALCAPVLIPFLLSTGNNVPKNVAVLLQFLGGRLFGYLLFALLAWSVSGLLLFTGGFQDLLIGGTYICLSALLLVTPGSGAGRSSRAAAGIPQKPRAAARAQPLPG